MTNVLSNGVMTFSVKNEAAAFINEKWGNITEDEAQHIDVDVVGNPGWLTLINTKNNNMLLIPTHYVIGLSWTKDPRRE